MKLYRRLLNYSITAFIPYFFATCELHAQNIWLGAGLTNTRYFENKQGTVTGNSSYISTNWQIHTGNSTM
ncbi:MAG: hypothetical protein GC181_12720 [Bacteroidetes bacterium]|nr:hypothetical protein [Bacteroidota bacterium]